MKELIKYLDEATPLELAAWALGLAVASFCVTTILLAAWRPA